MNLVMARTYLSVQDPKMITRTWADVLARFCDRSNPNTKMRHERVARTKPMLFLKPKRLVETTADDLLEAIKIGPKSTIVLLQTIHNDALSMGWIPGAILPRKLWPKMKKKARRAITEPGNKFGQLTQLPCKWWSIRVTYRLICLSGYSDLR